jgi:hypothetical protein
MSRRLKRRHKLRPPLMGGSDSEPRRRTDPTGTTAMSPKRSPGRRRRCGESGRAEPGRRARLEELCAPAAPPNAGAFTRLHKSRGGHLRRVMRRCFPPRGAARPPRTTRPLQWRSRRLRVPAVRGPFHARKQPCRSAGRDLCLPLKASACGCGRRCSAHAKKWRDVGRRQLPSARRGCRASGRDVRVRSG